MSKFLKTLLAAAVMTTAAVTNASSGDAEYSNGILLCDAGSSFARFGAAMGGSSEDLGKLLGVVGCVNHLDHMGSIVATTANGVRFERVGDVKTRLVRIVAADGAVLGYAQYRGYMYPPAQRAAVDTIISRAEVK